MINLLQVCICKFLLGWHYMGNREEIDMVLQEETGTSTPDVVLLSGKLFLEFLNTQSQSIWSSTRKCRFIYCKQSRLQEKEKQLRTRTASSNDYSKKRKDDDEDGLSEDTGSISTSGTWVIFGRSPSPFRQCSSRESHPWIERCLRESGSPSSGKDWSAGQSSM